MKSKLLANLINEEIKKSEVYLEYQKAKEIVLAKYDLKAMDKDLRAFQKELVSDYTDENLNKYLKMRADLEENEDIANYFKKKEELNKLISELFLIISDNL